ncbi:MAG: DUF1816 domain-containing protein [Synechococcales cyanobacterium T60_A2020_003]|nr:DUF1816 domain-containing protein [Synechococcales cyanobacterium T60_A2020_003]
MKEIWLSLLELLGKAWWIEVTTDSPRCSYFFGPFASKQEAEAAQSGFVEDLKGEGATNIRVQIRQCKPDPKKLTVYDEAVDRNFPMTVSPMFSS